MLTDSEDTAELNLVDWWEGLNDFRAAYGYHQ